jgi:hypothetical protein
MCFSKKKNCSLNRLVLLNLPYLAWSVMKMMDGSYLVDASKVSL